MADTGSIESVKEFKQTPTDQQRLWMAELKAALDNVREYWDRGDKVVKRFLDERAGGDEGPESRLNLFHSNVITLRALLYGKIPQVDVDRRFQDADDDEARVGAEILERILNTDIERDDDTYAEAIRNALEDWTLPGMGQVRCRYEVEWEQVPEQPAQMGPCQSCQGAMPDCPMCMGTGEVEMAPPVPAHEAKAEEDAETDYVYWKDFLWSPSRTWAEVPWVAFRLEMTKDEVAARFGESLAKLVKMTSKGPSGDEKDKNKDAWLRAEIWEIWSKRDRMVIWVSEGMDRILDRKPDPLGLDGFFPCPKPLMSNATTTKMIPKPDFYLAQDLYNEIDRLTTRLKLLEESARVAGAYDAQNDGLQRLVKETHENQLVPVKNFAQFMEKGGIAGAIAWLPLDQIIRGIEILTAKRAEKIQLLYQVTGMSDIMRGQGQQYATATEQRIKAGFASTRVQTMQDELARFATDAQRIRAQIISKHFDAGTIAKRSNVAKTKDAKLAPQAIALVKSDLARYRIQVRPDSISLPDLAARKQEGVEFITAMTQFLMAMKGLPREALPYTLEMLKWAMSRFPGSATIEGVLDEAIVKAQQIAAMPPPPPPPDPKLQAAQVKAQAEAGKAKATMMQTGMDMKRAAMQTQLDTQKAGMEHQFDMQKLIAQNAVDQAKFERAMQKPEEGDGE